jgi:hypothetical protein
VLGETQPEREVSHYHLVLNLIMCVMRGANAPRH